MTTERIDMDLRLDKSDWLSDWYVLNGGYCTIPEGTPEEWMQIAKGMRERKPVHFKRCAAWYDKNLDCYRFCSPRNSYGESDSCSTSSGKAIDELADHILKVLQDNGEPCIFEAAGFDPVAMGC
jgi:hypothetical protein